MSQQPVTAGLRPILVPLLDITGTRGHDHPDSDFDKVFGDIGRAADMASYEADGEKNLPASPAQFIENAMYESRKRHGDAYILVARRVAALSILASVAFVDAGLAVATFACALYVLVFIVNFFLGRLSIVLYGAVIPASLALYHGLAGWELACGPLVCAAMTVLYKPVAVDRVRSFLRRRPTRDGLR